MDWCGDVWARSVWTAPGFSGAFRAGDGFELEIACRADESGAEVTAVQTLARGATGLCERGSVLACEWRAAAGLYEGRLGAEFPTDFAGLAGEIGEDALGHVAREIGGIDLAQRGGKDEVRVTRDDFGKGGFPAMFGLGAEQLGVGLVLHLTH
jgi:hypothetical protein